VIVYDFCINKCCTTDINEITSIPLFYLFPNPANDKITIIHNNNILQDAIVSIFNLFGQQILCKKIDNKNSLEFDVHFLSKGIYIVKVQLDNIVEIKKLVIQ
jgi:hypothetical protein